MGRYGRDRAEITRSMILRAATGLFVRHGVREVSLARIMGDIGMTPGGFYKYFDSKEALAGEVCTRSFQRAQDAWQAAVDRAEAQSQCPLQALVGDYLQLARDGHCPMVAFGHDAAEASHDPAFAQAYRHGTETLLGTLVGASPPPGTPASRERSLILFAAMLGAGLLSRTAGAEDWMRDIEAALLGQLD